MVYRQLFNVSMSNWILNFDIKFQIVVPADGVAKPWRTMEGIPRQNLNPHGSYHHQSDIPDYLQISLT